MFASKRQKLSLPNVIIWLVGMGLTLIWLIPIAWMIVSSLKPEGEILSITPEWIPSRVTIEHYIKIFEFPVILWFRNSVIVATATTVLRLVVAAPAGYAFARFQFRGKNALSLLALTTMMIPFEVSLVPLYLLVTRLGLRSTLTAMVVPGIANVVALFVFRQFFLALPKELEDAAAIDGCGPWMAFFRIALPLAKPAILVVIILGFVENWNAFLWPLVMSTADTKTLAVGVTRFNPTGGDTAQSQFFGPAMAAATLMAIPSLLIYFVLQRYFVEGVTTSGLKG
jgi:ABC-type glycerol-3-phosphate transport system permease component